MTLTQANIAEAFMQAGRLQKARRFDEAEALWRRILAAAPQSVEARGNLAGLLLETARLEEAEAVIRDALAAQPDALWARRQLARVLHLARRHSEAEAAYQAVLALAPEDAAARVGLAELYLALGDYARGWPLYEARGHVAGYGVRRPPWPREWRGEPLAGRSLLIWPEQGFGDQIQFARFAPVLRDQGASVTLAAPPELKVLFATLGVAVVDQTAEPPAVLAQDAWTLPLSIPHRLGVAPGDIPAAPYLAAPEARRERWAGYVLPGTVGLVWRGRATHRNDAWRSLPSAEPLRAPLSAAGARILDLSYPLGDFADLAAVIAQLDLLVSVDTAAAHLAGALGKRCYLLLPAFRTDWRWQEGRADTPWYPSLRLFRQPARGGWAPVGAAVAEAWRAEFGS